jgi:hypothetical protein
MNERALSFIVVYSPGRGLHDVLQFSDHKRAAEKHMEMQIDVMNAGGRGDNENVHLFMVGGFQQLVEQFNLYFTRWADGSPVDVEKLAATVARDADSAPAMPDQE